MAGGGEETRFRDIGQLGFLLGGFQRVRHLPALCDIVKGDDDALDFIIVGAVWHHAPPVPGAGARLDLALDRRETFQDKPRILQKRAVARQRAEVSQRAPDIAGNDAEEQLGRRREKADVQLPVEEQRRDIGAVEHVLQIVRRRALALQCFLKLMVQSRQLLIQRL